MLRAMQRAQVQYGHYNDYAECWHELNKLLAERGMKQWHLFSPITGKDNLVVTTCDYDSYEELKREQDGLYSDPECMKLYRAAAQFLIQGSGESEILDEAPHLA